MSIVTNRANFSHENSKNCVFYPLDSTMSPKTFGGRTYTVTIEAPDESWAIDNEYDYRGTVEIDDEMYMKIWWGGSGDDSKGFMISGNDGRDNVSYIQWDRSGDDQIVRFVLANFPSGTFLGAATESTSSGWGDMAVYGSISYNKETHAVSAQEVLVENQRGANVANGNFGCFKLYASGEKGGEMFVAKTKDGFSATGHAVGSTAVDGTDMDAVVIQDLSTTPNGCTTDCLAYANQTAFNAAGKTVVQDVSCNYVNTLGSTAFASASVNFDYGPDDVF